MKHLITKVCAVAAVGLFHSIAMAKETPLACRVEPERSVLAAGVQENITVKVTLTGAESPSTQERAPVNLALVIDRSGSMGGERIKQARAAAIFAIERLSPEDIVSVVTFDDRIETIVPAQHVTDKRGIIAKIQEITPRGSTAIFGGVSQGAAEIRKNLDRDYINRIILLSDGQANVGPASPADLGRLGTALMKENISVTTVGVGLGYNEDLMTRLAGTSDGNSYFAENDDDLPRIFQGELGSVLSVVAKAINLKVTFPEGAIPVELIGRDGFIDGNTVTLAFNQIYGSQDKYVLIRTICAPGKDGSTRLIANAEASYQDAMLNRPLRTTAAASVRFSEDKNVVAKSVNKEVIRDRELNITALESARAIKLADEGKRDEAAMVMKSRSEKLSAVSVEYDMEVLAEEARRQSSVSERVRAAPMGSATRKAITTSNYETQNQQPTKK
ncbi:MAG: VWA domain-containing protein [Kiritimatiellaeota bacterium]|nr:VWA domain-containing protein [Kiritimatiellota bacterium]